MWSGLKKNDVVFSIETVAAAVVLCKLHVCLKTKISFVSFSVFPLEFWLVCPASREVKKWLGGVAWFSTWLTEPSFYGSALVILTLRVLLSSRECTRGGFCNFMHLKPISRELRRELYGRRKKKYTDFFFNGGENSLKKPFGLKNKMPLSVSPGTALTPENDVPAPRIVGVTATGGGQGIESALEDSERSQNRLHWIPPS